MKNVTDRDREVLLSEKNRIEVEWAEIKAMNEREEEFKELHLNNSLTMSKESSQKEDFDPSLAKILHLIERNRINLQIFLEKTNAGFKLNLDKLIEEIKSTLDFNAALQRRCDEIIEEKNRIASYCNILKKERQPLLKVKVDEAIQTEFGSEPLLVEKLPEKQVLSDCVEDRVEYNRFMTTDKAGSKEDDCLDGTLFKRDSFVTMWKETKAERKDIDSMKRRSQEMKSNLEKRLKVVNDFIKRSWLSKAEEYKKRTFQSDLTSGCKTLNQKHAELQQLKAQLLHEIDKLQGKETMYGKIPVSDKANQTVQLDAPSLNAKVPLSAQSSGGIVPEGQLSPAMNSGLFGQLRRYCYRCCCHCCACCKQVDTEEQ
ncbi:uncharacterized protein [Takifugu rubripes]|uniref:uncharacterized protein n=1 Tax=Takifugu rubripes TaxID=31033 RepID=UPI0011452D1D|nr:uncharacterized protein LOC115252614 [Takifugu rubripes]